MAPTAGNYFQTTSSLFNFVEIMQQHFRFNLLKIRMHICRITNAFENTLVTTDEYKNILVHLQRQLSNITTDMSNLLHAVADIETTIIARNANNESQDQHRRYILAYNCIRDVYDKYIYFSDIIDIDRQSLIVIDNFITCAGKPHTETLCANFLQFINHPNLLHLKDTNKELFAVAQKTYSSTNEKLEALLEFAKVIRNIISSDITKNKAEFYGGHYSMYK